MKIKKKIIIGSLLTLILLPLVTAGVLYTITNPQFKIDGWADMDTAILSQYSTSYTLTDCNGDDAFSISSSGNSIAAYEDIKEHTINAFVAAEDKRFYNHKGVDYYRILGAALSNVKSFGLKEGASTITQQLIKNTHLNSEKTMTRKLKEIRIAREVEQNYSKDEIITMYLNALYFGHNIYGISNAANYYFYKEVSDLSLSESAVLAAIINSPSHFDPIDHPDNTKKRRDIILGRMNEQGYITEEAMSYAVSEEIVVSKKHVFPQYQYFVMNEKPTVSGGKIKTYYNPAIQSAAVKALDASNISDMLISVLILDVESGTIAAAASNTVADISGVVRQPGSVIKPIICYAPALEDSIITPITPLNDAPADFAGYKPSNYNDKYYGWQTAEKCLSYSLNVPAVKLLEMNGIKRSKNFARKLGMKISEDDNGLAIALGGLKNGVSLRQLADAYAAFARGGRYASSRTQISKKQESAKVMHEDTAYFINKMLTSCAQSGTAKSLRSIKNIAAKTGTVGTSEGNTDAYCIAYNSSYVAAVWVGAQTGIMPENITGGGLPTVICGEIMKNSALSCAEFKKPSSVVTLEIDTAEYENNHKLVIANESYAIKDKMSAEFSLRNLPTRAKIDKNNKLNGDNFKIVDNFSN